VKNARRAALLPVAVAVGGVLFASSPAYAKVTATWSKPTDNAVFTTTAPIEIGVALDRGSTLTADGSAVTLSITVPGPQPGPFKLDTSTGTGDRDLRFTFTPACDNHAGPCFDGGAPAYNGQYSLSLSGASTGTRLMRVQVPPAAPSGVSASATGEHRVRVAWSANREPDLTSYDVFTAEGQTIAADLPVDTLSYEFDLPETGYGGTHSYVVRAHRLACANCPGSTDTVASAMSSPATVTLDEPTPDPEPTPGDGTSTGGNGTGGTGNGNGNGGNGSGYDGGTGNGSTGSGSGSGSTGSGSTGSGDGSTGYNNGSSSGDGAFTSGEKVDPAVAAAQQRLAFGLTFKSFAPKLGAPKLPPLPKFAPSDEIPEGTYDPMLDYGDQTVAEHERVASGGVTDQLVDSVVSVFQGQRLFRSIAIALLLLLAAGHMRVWLRNTPHP
jgi:hypothetical protein